MALLYSSNFDSDAVGTLPPGWVSVIGDWKVATGGPVSGLNSLRTATGAGFDSVLYEGSGAQAADGQVGVSTKYAGNDACPGLYFRMNADCSNGYFIGYLPSNGNINFFNKSAGGAGGFGLISIGAANGMITPEVGDVFAQEVSFVGDTVEFRVWNVTKGQTRPAAQFSQVSTFKLTAGFGGVMHGNNASPQNGFDDFYIQDTSVASPATAVTVTGPTGGVSGQASGNYQVSANGTISGNVVVTPSVTGGGTFSPTTVTLSAGSPTATFTYTPASAGSKTISFTNNGGLANPADKTYVATASGGGAVSITRNDPAIYYSPFVWDDVAGARKSIYPGAYLTLAFSGTSIAAVLQATTGLTNYPVLRAFIDDLPPVDFQIAAGQTALPIASGLAAGPHRIKLFLNRLDDYSSQRWAGNNAAKIVSFTLDAGATVQAITPKTRTAVAFGDSISYSTRSESINDLTGTNASQTIFGMVAEALDAELGLCGFGGANYAAGGVGDNPSFLASYDQFTSGRSRLVGGVFSPALDFCFLMHGTNGGFDQNTAAQAILAARSKMPNTRIFMIVPPGGFNRAPITAATNEAILAGDTNLTLIDAGTDMQRGLTGFGPETAASFDGIHLKQAANARFAARITALIQHAIEPRRFTVVAS